MICVECHVRRFLGIWYRWRDAEAPSCAHVKHDSRNIRRNNDQYHTIWAANSQMRLHGFNRIHKVIYSRGINGSLTTFWFSVSCWAVAHTGGGWESRDGFPPNSYLRCRGSFTHREAGVVAQQPTMHERHRFHETFWNGWTLLEYHVT